MNRHADLASAERLLSSRERERAMAFRFDRHRRRFILRRAMRRVLLAHLADMEPADLEFSESDRGKPQLIGADFEFNTSHTGDVGVIVTGSTPLGVDIEAIDRPMDYLKFAKRMFTEEEFLDISQARDDELPVAFFNCWTGKEAYVKAIGQGLHKDLRSFSVECAPGSTPGLRWSVENDASAWRFERISTGEHVITIIAQHAAGDEDIHAHTLSTESLCAGVPVSVE